MHRTPKLGYFKPSKQLLFRLLTKKFLRLSFPEGTEFESLPDKNYYISSEIEAFSNPNRNKSLTRLKLENIGRS